MTFLTKPMTVAELRMRLADLPDDAAVWVHGSNGWGPGAERALHRIEADRRRREVHLYGSYL